MYLKALHIKGFKSFADPVKLVFVPGLSAVIGPNGSGKSNVSDAVLWALGEQSPKHLRGATMEDVIFSGSKERSSKALAEVTLEFDNSDRAIALDVATLSITRRMRRSGESEYLINGSQVRLLDIQNLLSDVGLGKQIYSVIAQGKLDSVLNAQPEERIRLIEDVAGISKHQRRRNKALKKLEKIDEYVTRIKDVRRHMQRQLKPLERQAHDAQHYESLVSRSAELKESLAVEELRELQRDAEKLSVSHAENELLLSTRQDVLRGLEEDLQTVRQQLGEAGYDKAEALKARIAAALSMAELNAKRLDEKRKRIAGLLQQTQEEKERDEVSLSKSRTSLDEIQAQLRKTESEIEENTHKKNTQEEAAQTIAKKLHEARHDAETAQEAIRNNKNACAQAKAREGELEQARDKDASEPYEKRVKSLKEQMQRAKKQQSELADEINKKTVEVKRLRSLHEDASEKLKETSVELARARTNRDELSAHVAELKLQKTTLKKLLLRADLPDNTGLQQLMEVVSIKQDVEALAELVLGDSLHAFIAHNEQELQRIIRENEHVSAFIASDENKVAKGNVPGVSLAELSDGGPAFFDRMYVVDTLDEALRAHRTHPGYIFVTKDGVVLDSLGVAKKGEATLSQDILKHVRELKQVERDIAHHTRLKDDAEANFVDVSERSAALEQEDAEYVRLLAELEPRLAALNNESHGLQDRIAWTSEELSRAEQHYENFNKKRQEDERELEKVHQNIKNLESDLPALEKRSCEFLNVVRDLSAQQESLTQEVAQRSAQEVVLAERRTHLKQAIAELEDSLSTNDHGSVYERRLVLLERLAKSSDSLGRALEDLITLMKGYASELKESQQGDTHVAELKEREQKMCAQLEDARNQLQEASRTAEDIRITEAQLAVKVEAAFERVKEYASGPYEQALNAPLLKDKEQAQDELANITHKLERMGPINQVAAQDFERISQTLSRIDSVLDDVVASRKALKQIISAINRKTESVFFETFRQVNANFKELFSLLFPGGTAKLVLTDENEDKASQQMDSYQSSEHSGFGLEVICQPKGKLVPRMALLSGGEKSLCALALLFAIYKVHTVPFYIFDEVEAALDDINLHRLLRALKTLKQTTQLIVISHQRATIEAADVLWGVSMGSDGVSQVISRQLSDEAV